MSKTHFFTHVKKTPFSQTRCHFWFWAISAETTIFISFSWFTLFGPKKFLAKTDSVHEIALFSPFLTQMVSGNFCKKSIFFDFAQFCMTTFKNPIFIGFWGLFHFFFSFLCSYFSNIRKTKTKDAIFFSKTSFLTSPEFSKNTILAQCDTICVFKNTPKTL